MPIQKAVHRMRWQFLLWPFFIVLGIECSEATELAIPELYILSYEQEKVGDYYGSLETMAHLYVSGEDGYSFRIRTGWLNFLAGRFDHSIIAYRQAIEVYPEAIEPHLGLMKPLMSLHKWHDALDVTKWILNKDPANYLGLCRQADCSFQLGNFDAAIELYLKVLADYPGDLETRTSLGWALLRHGDSAEAKAEFLKVMKLSLRSESANKGLAACN